MTAKRCRSCGDRKPSTEFGPKRGTCNECRRRQSREYYEANREAVLARQQRQPYSSDAWLRGRYGITLEDYDALVAAQGGRCAICNRAPTKLFVDHDHISGVVRGLLCDRCNCGLGHLRDSVVIARRAARYLRGDGLPG